MSAALRTLLRDRLSSVLEQVLERVLEELDRTLEDYEADSRRLEEPLKRALQPRVQLRRTGVQVPDSLQIKPEPQDQDQDQDQHCVSGVWAPGPLQIKQERQDEGRSVSESSAAAPAKTEDSDQIQILAVTSLNCSERQDDSKDSGLWSGVGQNQKTEAGHNEPDSERDKSDSRGPQNDSGHDKSTKGPDVSDSIQEYSQKNSQTESDSDQNAAVTAERPRSHSPVTAAATRTSPKPNEPETGRDRYMCFCGKLFDKEALRRHQSSHHAERPFSCSCCGQTFRFCTELEEHTATSHRAERESCRAVFSGTSTVPGHKCAGSRKRRRTEAFGLKETGAEGQPSSEGTESFRDTRRLQTKGNGVKEKVDSGCRRGRRGRKSFQNKTQNVREFPGQSSDDVETFQNKVSQSSQEEQSKAEGPGLSAPSGDDPSGSRLRCSFCGKKFSLRSAFLSHVREHAGKPLYTCDVCGRGFTWLPRLYKHRKTHSGEKLFWCSDCGRTFRERRDLRAHLCVQTGQKPYRCPVCGEDFFLRIQLETHMTLHSNK